MRIPYEKIDHDIIPLIKAMNNCGYIKTLGCCIGHEINKPSEVIFKVIDEKQWQLIMPSILLLNSLLRNANIDVYQWYRLDCDNQHITDWLFKIEVHPGIISITEELRIKKDIIDKLVGILKDDRVAAPSSFAKV
ncbi:hypothetical protein SDC9_04160 [bioreactor metagenome]|uniref:Uncharacterized protein n=1 Tax=bioreactor metagenome TaxID=1076179 RepID=A0A644SVF2_9ZZZZ|nr:hypothetical protein [Negativicutes bacterium]